MGVEVLTTSAHALLIAAVIASGCQPWYRDAERGGRLVLDEGTTAQELQSARVKTAAGRPDAAAAILSGTVHRNPKVRVEVWIALVDAEIAAGDTVKARAHARWELARIDAQNPGTTRLRGLLIDSLAKDGLVASALDLVEPQTLAAALSHPALAVQLGDLGVAVTRLGAPEIARTHLGFWLTRYGEPDHPILRAAREQIALSLWSAASPDTLGHVAALRELPEMIHEELAAGNLEGALIAYAEARKFLPDDMVGKLASDLERAASAAGVTALTPDVHRRAVEADRALARGDLAGAVTRYRLVVLHAPWWRGARRNLESLLLFAGR